LDISLQQQPPQDNGQSLCRGGYCTTQVSETLQISVALLCNSECEAYKWSVNDDEDLLKLQTWQHSQQEDKRQVGKKWCVEVKRHMYRLKNR